MTVLIVYASTEGQTRKICRFCAAELSGAGMSVELLSAADAAGTDVGRYRAAILAGSVHIGKIQPALIDFARQNGAALAAIPTLYLQVSLAAAGRDPDEMAELQRIAKAAFADTGWTPGRTEHVAGAFRFTEYDFFRTLAMRWIASQRDDAVDPHKDKEYTDWDALSAVLAEWRETVQAASAAGPR
jgi:menaquinone-dependent protoporphyrinogen oxidase